MAAMRGRTKTDWLGVCLEAPDPHALADFYAAVLGWPVAQRDEHGAAIQVGDTDSFVSFQEAEHYVPPVWPAEPGKQLMMMHLDVAVDDLDEAVAAARELGATLAAYQPQDDVRVLLDPAGHPFCLYLDRD
jgi:catechol 2,3-dioxygenase-like lactoylglutathione lyase family enzyme